MTAPTSTPAPKPTPGATAWLHAVETVTTPDGTICTETTYRWGGYTAADLRTHWAARAKTARWTHRWDDGALIVTMPATGKTITRTFHDQEPSA